MGSINHIQNLVFFALKLLQTYELAPKNFMTFIFNPFATLV